MFPEAVVEKKPTLDTVDEDAAAVVEEIKLLEIVDEEWIFPRTGSIGITKLGGQDVPGGCSRKRW